MLKFSSTPVLRRKVKTLRVAKAKVYTQHYEAIDEFGELAGRKRDAAKKARELGHDLIPWHQRPNDPAGRWNAFCATCNAAVVVCTEAPDGFDDIYGPAFTKDCTTS